jgi:hypothetical protein
MICALLSLEKENDGHLILILFHEKNKSGVLYSPYIHGVNKKRNPNTDLPPFLTRQRHARYTLLRAAAV